MNIRKFLQTAVMAGALLGLAGCEDIHNAGSEIGQRFDDMHFSNPFKSDGAKIAETPAVTNCMPVTVVSELKSLSQFSDEMAPRAENNISTVSIGTVTSKCAQNDKNLSVDLDIAFNGLLGARARSWNAAKPSFSYPYFVALTMPDGAIVTKEVFSVTVSYDKDQDTVTRHEHMRQVIPLLQGVTSRPQQVVIGFQLKSQLSYNRSLAGKQNVAAGPVPADLAASDKKTAPATAAKKARPKVKAKAKHKKPKPVAKPAAAPAVTTAPDATSAPAPAPVTQTPSPAAEETPSDLTAPVNNAAPAATTTTTTTTTTMPEVNATPPAQSPANSAPAAATPVPVAPTPPAPPAQPSSDKPMEMENLMTTPPPSGQQ